MPGSCAIEDDNGAWEWVLQIEKHRSTVAARPSWRAYLCVSFVGRNHGRLGCKACILSDADVGSA
jgi:hypothetical protein